MATTAPPISEVAGLRVGDVDLDRGLLHVCQQTYPGCGRLVTKTTKGRRRRSVPIIEPLRPTLVRLTIGRRADQRLVVGPRGGVVTTATLRDATGWDTLVAELGQPGLVRHGLRHSPDLDGGRESRVAHSPAGRGTPGSGRHFLVSAPRCPGNARRRHGIFGQVVQIWSKASNARRDSGRAEFMVNGRLTSRMSRLRWSG